MIVKLNKNCIVIFITFILLVMSNGKYFIEIGINQYMEYFSLGLIVIECIYSFMLNIKERKSFKKDIINFFIISFLFCMGIIVQDLNVLTKLRLLFTMLALDTYMILSTNFLNDYTKIRCASYGVFVGTIITTIISLITKTSVLDPIKDNSINLFMSIGFTGGLEYKNFYGGVILACFIGVFLYFKKVENNKKDFILLIILFFLEILSGAKGSIILLIIFLIGVNLDKVKLPENNTIKWSIVGIAIVLVIIFSYFVINKIILESNTYAYRIRGVINYYNCYKDDVFHLLFGNAEIAFKNPDVNYVTNIRRDLLKHGIKSWDGSYEMAFINILIKNGIIGIIGYIYVFIIYIVNTLKNKKQVAKEFIFSIIFILLVSSLVESFMCNIHAIFGVFCYIVINGLVNIEKNKEI